MNWRRESPGFAPLPLRGQAEDKGQMASTVRVAESEKEV